VEKKKKPVNKNQGCEPIQQKYKANKKTSRHNSTQRKNKSKQSTKKIIRQRPYACIEELMVTK
jgi:hypothetical protein